MNELDGPHCGAVRIVKNGHAHTGKQRHLCRVCGHRFTFDHSRPPISLETVGPVERLLSERLSHRGICRAVGVSRSWFRRPLEKLAKSVPHSIDPAEVVSSKT
ncbi:hypothetical protein [Deinococcus sp.]|uniref:IS1/IS1595 family N-terminal zinc-binding domain-containing protein n=1 Tax=Deinococcus sp. TaxID=47478 RepID=UPI00286EA79D|nr:hypothetical protein [Deinococcus sp.]